MEGVHLYNSVKEAPILWNEKLNEDHWEFINKKLLHRVMNNSMGKHRDMWIEWRNMT